MNLPQVGQEDIQVSHTSGKLTSASGSLKVAPRQQLEGGAVSRNMVSVPLMGITSSADQPWEEDIASHDVVSAPVAGRENQLHDIQPPTRKRVTLRDCVYVRAISL